MAKRKRLDENERLEQEMKKLKSENRHLHKELKKSSKKYKPQFSKEALMEEDNLLNPNNNLCNICMKGTIRELDLGPRKLLSCSNGCKDARKVLKK